MNDKFLRYVCDKNSLKVCDHSNVRFLEWNNVDYLLMKEFMENFNVNSFEYTLKDWKGSEEFGFKFCAYIQNGKILSMAGAIMWTPTSEAWEVGAVQTREGARNNGYAKKVVSFATNYVLESRSFATCNTREDNIAMQKVALSVGFYRQD